MNKKVNVNNVNNDGCGGCLKWFFIVMGIMLFISFCTNKKIKEEKERKAKTFTIISSTSTKRFDEELINYGKKKGYNIEIEHYGDLEIIDMLNSDSKKYNAVWISNSIWLYMLNNSSIVQDSKSIVMDPVVMAIQKSKAEELGFIGKDIYNKDILKAIKDGKLKYVMASVTKTNTGATTYLNFLNSLAGSPEVLTSKMIKEEKLQKDLIDLFKGVERVSGDEDYLTEMYLKSDYNAMINYESTLIDLNKKLVSENKEPLYLLYPVDGVAINDMPFAYINNDSKDTKKKEIFSTLQSYLRSNEVTKKLEEIGYRTWYGGVNDKADGKTFNKDWGIDTTKYLKNMKYPSKKVITEAINLYIEKFRKPTHVVFCLDISGSMYGKGLTELKEAMEFILDYDKASTENLQFSSSDKITIITFNGQVDKIYETRKGNQTNDIIKDIDRLETNGSTNIYSPSIEALKILKEDSSNEYTKTIILMTDGESNSGSYESLKRYYNSNEFNIPIYSITFGKAKEEQLKQIAELTNGKVFDGKQGLRKAFKEVRSYN